MKDMDAVAFAMMMGATELAEIVALHNAHGDPAEAESAIAKARIAAELNMGLVPPGEDSKPS